MTREIICPGCKLVIPLDSDELSGLEPALTVETIVPRTACEDALDASDPDREVFGEAIGSLGSVRVEEDLAVEAGTSGPLSPSGSDDELDALNAGPDSFLASFLMKEASEEVAAVESGVGVLGQVSALPPPEEIVDHHRTTPDTAGTIADRDQADSTAASVGPSLVMLLLASYASAVTLALAWLLWSGWGATPPRGAGSIVGKARPDLEGDGRSFVESLPDLSPRRLTTLGHPVRVDDLEITPIDVALGEVELEGLDGERKSGEGGPSLRLRLRLRNTSEAKEFAPLENAFLRTPDRGPPESLVVAAGRSIAPYPLATTSEWSIVGQPLGVLKPGEEREVVVASEPDVEGRLSSRMTWRLRVRSTTDRTEVVGVEFDRSELVGTDSP